MRRRRSHAQGAPASVAGALLVAVLVLSGTCAVADAPWPRHPPHQDPARYEQYAYSSVPPDDYLPTDDDYWKYSSECGATLYHALIGLFHPGLDRRELGGITGASVDRAWSVTTGRPDVVIAVLDTGMRWGDAAAMGELARKCCLNPGELPPPQGAECWDANGDGVFNVDDYAGDPRVSDLNGNGVIDPQDIIWTFSNGEDDDGNGYVDDICGWDFLEDDNDPWDEVGDGHGTAGAMWSGAEANNGSGIPGVCPNAMLLPVRVGDSFAADMNAFAQGVVFAVDAGASVVQAALAGANNTSLAREAVLYASSRGVAVVASAEVGGSEGDSYPAAYRHAIRANAVQKYASGPRARQFPPSYLYLGGETAHGAASMVCVPSDGHSSGAAARLAGIAALVYSAAENKVRRGEMWRYPGLETPLSACEVKQVMAMTADDVDFSPCAYATSFGDLDALIGPSRRYPSHAGWDPYFGYGRVNAWEAVTAVERGRIPPEAEIASPAWFEPLNPGSVALQITGRVAAVRADSFSFTVEWGPGRDPAEEEWITAGEGGSLYRPVEGVLAALDLGEVYARVMETLQGRGGEGDPNRYAFTVRVRVRDDRGNWGEDRVTAFCFHDPDAFAGAPLRLEAGISASPRFADLDGDGTDELIVATDDGVVHAFKSDGSELPGWPVHATPLPLHVGSEAFVSGAVTATAYASIIGTPAVGDLDHDGTLEVVAGDMQGRIHAWDARGRPLPGFPVRSNPLYSIPERGEWWAEGALPDEWHAARFVPDRIHALDAGNRLQRGFPRGPVLCNLDASADGSLEIIAACLDRHVYAWHADGEAVEGWPVKLADPAKVASLDPLTHRCEFADAASLPAGGPAPSSLCAADLDGDGALEVVCASGEMYAGEVFNASARTLDLAAAPPGWFDPHNVRVYALHRDGVAHGLEEGASPAEGAIPAQAYLPGWPVRLAVAVPEMRCGAGQGVKATAAIADLDGDGGLEIGVSAVGGAAFLLNADGTSFLGCDELRLPLGLQRGDDGGVSGCGDLQLAGGGSCFAALGAGGLSFVTSTTGLGRVTDMNLPADQAGCGGAVSAWCDQGGMLASFPAELGGGAASPAVADVDGDGAQEILAGGCGRDLHAVGADGREPAGWPRFIAGSCVGTPAVGDHDGDGWREVAAGTREGWLFVWRTPAEVSAAADWPQHGHDGWNTGCLACDASRPGRVVDLAVEATLRGEKAQGVRLAWTAPGGDGRLGQAMCYEIRFSAAPIDPGNWKNAIPLNAGKPLPAPAGSHQEYVLEGFPFSAPREGTVYYFALQARDEAGNLSALSNTASLSYAETERR